MFQYDGKCVANPEVIGRWEVVHAVDEIEDSKVDPKTVKGPGKAGDGM